MTLFARESHDDVRARTDRPAAPALRWNSVRRDLLAVGRGVAMAWRVATAPIRLAVWLMEATLTTLVFGVVAGLLLWATGVLPTATVKAYATPLFERASAAVGEALLDHLERNDRQNRDAAPGQGPGGNSRP